MANQYGDRSQVSELFQTYEGNIIEEQIREHWQEQEYSRQGETKEVETPPESAQPAEGAPQPTEERKKTNYKLDIIDVTEAPINNNLTLKNYMLRSLTGVLHQGSNLRQPFYYLMDIKNNVICSGPYTEARGIFDSESLAVYHCKRHSESLYVTIDQYGVAHHEPVEKMHKVNDMTFDFNSQSFSFPTQTTGKEYMERHGSLIVLKVGQKSYLVNFEHGSLIGFSFPQSTNQEGHIMVGAEEKYPLARLSPEILLVRDAKTAEEEYIVRKSRLVIGKESVETAGGWFFLGPNEEHSTYLTFVPQELAFGRAQTFRDRNKKVYANGVYFGKEKILFVNTGEYFLNIGREGLESKIAIEDSLIFIQGGE